jgi:hypothetical protein
VRLLICNSIQYFCLALLMAISNENQPPRVSQKVPWHILIVKLSRYSLRWHIITNEQNSTVLQVMAKLAYVRKAWLSPVAYLETWKGGRRKNFYDLFLDRDQMCHKFPPKHFDDLFLLNIRSSLSPASQRPKGAAVAHRTHLNLSDRPSTHCEKKISVPRGGGRDATGCHRVLRDPNHAHFDLTVHCQL